MKAPLLPRSRFWIVMWAVCLISCSPLPVIKPTDQTAATVRKCRQPFLDTPYRFVHAIEAALPGGGSGTVLGITVFNPESKAIHSAILTLEGFVLFDARYDGKLVVSRALPPFNAERFAEHMMEDIRLIFLPPEGRLLTAGTLEDGSAICRYEGNQETIIDVIVHRDDSWEIYTYRNRYERLRTINVFSVRDGIPGMLELTGFESRNYSLRLKVISAEPLSRETIP